MSIALSVAPARRARGSARPSLPGLLAAVAVLLGSLPLAPAGAETRDAPGVFRVLDREGGIEVTGASATTAFDLFNGCRFPYDNFERPEYRISLTAWRDSPDRIITGDADLTGWNVARPSVWDGADVRIYRIENGRLSLKRRDKVAVGGAVSEAWRKIEGGIMTSGDARQVSVGWEPWYRPEAETWFALRAVDAEGRVSEMSNAVKAVSPQNPKAPTVLAAGYQAMMRETDRATGKRPASTEGAPPAPIDVTVETGPRGLTVLRWKLAPGASQPAGFEIMRTEEDPARMRGTFVKLEQGDQGEPVREGDMVILATERPGEKREELLSDRVWNAGRAARGSRSRQIGSWPEARSDVSWRYAPHEAQDQVEDGGDTYLEVTLHGRARFKVGHASFAGLDQTWYVVLEPRPYKVEFWAKAERPGNAAFSLGGPNAYAKSMRAQLVKLTPEWRRHVIEFTPPFVLETGIGTMELSFNGPNVVGLDNLRVYRADTPFMTYSDETIARMKADRIPWIRTHQPIRTRRWTYDLDRLTDQGEPYLAELLPLIRAAGSRPWLQVEPHFSPEEWHGLVEYLAAPADAGPWAAKRAAQGQAAPWTEVFDRIYFEIGNETWNHMFAPWIFRQMTDATTGEEYSRGEVYGLFQEYVISEMRRSPWWDAAGLEDKIEFVIGGWFLNDYGTAAARRSPSSSMITVGDYMMGWDSGARAPVGDPASYSEVLNWSIQSRDFFQQHVEDARALSGAERGQVKVGTYEAGPGYVFKQNGKDLTRAEQRTQEEVMKSQAAGTATLDLFLGRAASGYDGPLTYFLYGAGVGWTSQARWNQGGQDYPSWKVLALLNREGLGRLLPVETLSAPQMDLPKPRRRWRPALSGAPQATVYATRDGDRVNLFVLSRRVPGLISPGDDGCTPVEVALPFASVGALSVHRMDAPYDAHNVDADRVMIERETLAVPADPSRLRMGPATGAPECGLPAAATYLYVFEDVAWAP